jgi:hypothetical protein
MVFQLKTFQGVRYSLFHYTTAVTPGGFADFDAMVVDEPNPRGIARRIPIGRTIALTAAVIERPLTIGNAATFEVVDRGRGRVALKTRTGFVSVATDAGNSNVGIRSGSPTIAETSQWVETPYGDVALLSLATNRYLRLDVASNRVTANHPGPEPGRDDGSQFLWSRR